MASPEQMPEIEPPLRLREVPGGNLSDPAGTIPQHHQRLGLGYTALRRHLVDQRARPTRSRPLAITATLPSIPSGLSWLWT
jgi:hypothetical protein